MTKRLTCPVCNSPMRRIIVDNEKIAFCTNPKCKKKLALLKRTKIEIVPDDSVKTRSTKPLLLQLQPTSTTKLIEATGTDNIICPKCNKETKWNRKEELRKLEFPGNEIRYYCNHCGTFILRLIKYKEKEFQRQYVPEQSKGYAGQQEKVSNKRAKTITKKQKSTKKKKTISSTYQIW